MYPLPFRGSLFHLPCPHSPSHHPPPSLSFVIRTDILRGGLLSGLIWKRSTKLTRYTYCELDSFRVSERISDVWLPGRCRWLRYRGTQPCTLLPLPESRLLSHWQLMQIIHRIMVFYFELWRFSIFPLILTWKIIDIRRHAARMTWMIQNQLNNDNCEYIHAPNTLHTKVCLNIYIYGSYLPFVIQYCYRNSLFTSCRPRVYLIPKRRVLCTRSYQLKQSTVSEMNCLTAWFKLRPLHVITYTCQPP